MMTRHHGREPGPVKIPDASPGKFLLSRCRFKELGISWSIRPLARLRTALPGRDPHALTLIPRGLYVH